MKKYLLIILIILLLPLAGEAVEIGDTIELKATNQQGVPLHRAPHLSMFGYAPDGSRATVIDVAKGGRWLRIVLEDNQAGWIAKKNVAGIVSSARKDKPIATAQGDFNNDGYTDLAVGIPYKDVDNRKIDAGAVNILYGSASGLTGNGNRLFSQNTPGVRGEAENGDLFGYALAAGYFNNDGYADLAVGVPYEDLDKNQIDAGAVNILYGSASGLTDNGNQLFSQDTPGVSGGAENGDLFGYTLAAADFNNDGYADLVIGVSYKDVDTGGTVNILYGSASGLTAAENHFKGHTRDQRWDRELERKLEERQEKRW